METTDRATMGMLRMMTIRAPLANGLRAQALSLLLNTGVFTRFVSRAIGGMNVSYAESAIVGEHRVSLWRTEVGRAETERPTPGDWRRFHMGPGPGERVPDVDVSGTTLLDLLRGTRHKLWLSDGAMDDAGYANFTSIAERVTRRYGEQIDVLVVVPHHTRPARLAEPTRVLLDPDMTLHRHFGCSSEGLCLVRPDGHVGFRSQPADESALSRTWTPCFCGDGGSRCPVCSSC